MTKELFRKTTEQPDTKKSKVYDRLTVALDETTSKMLESFVRQVKDETGYKLAKSEIVQQLIKLIPELKLNAFYCGSLDDVNNQFDVIRKKLNQLS